MAKQKGSTILNIVMWLTGIIVSLAVGFGLVGGTLAVPLIGNLVNQIAGWIVVVTTLLGVILALLKL